MLYNKMLMGQLQVNKAGEIYFKGICFWVLRSWNYFLLIYLCFFDFFQQLCIFSKNNNDIYLLKINKLY